MSTIAQRGKNMFTMFSLSKPHATIEEWESAANDHNFTHDLFVNEEKEEAMSEFFLFDLDGELYAVSLTDIDQVMKIPSVTTVPNAPDSIVGVFHLRGKVIVVLDLLKRMHLSRSRALVPNYLFVAHHQKNYFGILVDRTRTMIRIPTRAH